MELGLSVLRRSGVNVLQGAVHDQRGLVWTDGRNIFLSPLRLGGAAAALDSAVQAQKLGSLEDIHGLCWSCEFAGGWCYLCVAQQQKISIWKVEGMLPASLKMKLVRKISKSPLSQGCLWNPSRELLCLVTKEQSIIYYKHADDKLKLVLPSLEEGKTLSCASWSADGEKLVVATQGKVCSIWVYVWDKIDSKLKQFHSWCWTCPQLSGYVIRSAVAASDDLVLLTTELCIQQLTRTGGAGDHDVDQTVSPTERLLNLAGSKDGSSIAGTEGSATSQLLLLSVLPQAALLQSSAFLKEMLAPDLLSFVPGLHQVVIGSNSQGTLQVYSIQSAPADGGSGGLVGNSASSGSNRPKLTWETDIVLARGERPKGVCPLPVSPQASVLLMIGTFADPADVTFPPSGMDCKYNLHLSVASLSSDPYVRPVAGQPPTTAAAGADLVSDFCPAGMSPLSDPAAEQKQLVVELPPASELDVRASQSSSSSSMAQEYPASLPPSSALLLASSRSQAADSSGLARAESSCSSNSVRGLLSVRTSSASEFVDASRFVDTGCDNNVDVPSSGSSSPAGSLRHGRTDSDLAVAEPAVAAAPSVVPIGSGGNSSSSSSMRSSIVSPRGAVSIPSATCTTLPASVESCGSRSSLDIPSDISELQQMLSLQAGQISSLRRRLDDLAAQVEETNCISLNVYQEPEAPDFVQLVFHRSQSIAVARSFLLDKGRLKLDTVQSVFGVTHLDLALDGLSVVLTSNADGYVPLRFDSGTTYHVSSSNDPSGEDVLAALAAAAAAATHKVQASATAGSRSAIPSVLSGSRGNRPLSGRGYGNSFAQAAADQQQPFVAQQPIEASVGSSASSEPAAGVAVAAGDGQEAASGVERPPRRRAKAPAPPLPGAPPARASVVPASASSVADEQSAAAGPSALPPAAAAAAAVAAAPPGTYIDITAAL